MKSSVVIGALLLAFLVLVVILGANRVDGPFNKVVGNGLQQQKK